MKFIIIMLVGLMLGCTSDVDLLRAEIETMKSDIKLILYNTESSERVSKEAIIKSEQALENVEVMDKKLDKIWKKTKGDRLP